MAYICPNAVMLMGGLRMMFIKFGLMVLGGAKTGVAAGRTILAFVFLLALLLISAFPARSQSYVNGTFTVSEAWSVTAWVTGNPPKTYTGTETGTISISNGQYSLIDHTGISGGDQYNTVTHSLAGGPPYTSLGEYPYAGYAFSTNGLVSVIHLGFFSIAIPTSQADGAPLKPSSVRFGITGQSLTGLSGSGSQDDGNYYYYTVSSTCSLQSYATSNPPPVYGPFFSGQATLPGTNGWYYLANSTNNAFGYYNLTFYPYVYHLDMGWEYYFDAGNANHGAYFYDFADGVWWYSEPAVFPSILDLRLGHWLWYNLQPGSTDRYTSNPRSFYDFTTKSNINHL